jgi:hypothetical protein
MMTFASRNVADVFLEFFRAGPLFYILMWIAVNATGAHAFVILKVAGPLFYGCLVVSFFTFLQRGLKFDGKMTFVTTLLLAFQVASLRVSWDRFRTVLGLTFLFATLAMLRRNSRYKWPFVAVFSVLTAFSRDYVALVLFVTLLGFAFWEAKERITSLVALCPAMVIFMAMVYPALSQLIQNYVPEWYHSGRSYLWVVQDAFVIFAVCYLTLLPFVLKGRFRDSLTGSMSGWLLLGSFSVVSPWFAIPGYQRWLMLLVFPFTCYAVRGFERFHILTKQRMKTLVAIALGFIVIGAGYSTGIFSYIGLAANSYVPINLLQSSIGWDHVDDVKLTLRWLNENAQINSSILTEERFYGWTSIYLERANKDVEVLVYGANSSPQPVLLRALKNGVCWIYLIWYTDSSLEDFQVIHSVKRISVFQYHLRT